ncbi:MAG: hypothetical protein WCT08_02315 [Patescibacteria group bacterium]|jgi:hypothetical protein
MDFWWLWRHRAKPVSVFEPDSVGHNDAYTLACASQLPPQQSSPKTDKTIINPTTIWDGEAANRTRRAFDNSGKVQPAQLIKFKLDS